MIRPANAGAWTPGRGLAVVEARNGVKVAVVNLLGSLFLDTPVSPWEVVDTLVDEARAAAPVVVVDFHAEATSEKVAMATWLDGRVTAVIGTHTHVQTNDARVLPGGTAAVTDVGMTGPHDSVIGVRTSTIIDRFRSEHKTVIVANHSIGLIRKVCNRAIWLDQGTIRMQGDVASVTAAYADEYHVEQDAN